MSITAMAQEQTAVASDGNDFSIVKDELVEGVRYVTADDYHDLIAGTLSDDFEPQTLAMTSLALVRVAMKSLMNLVSIPS